MRHDNWHVHVQRCTFSRCFNGASLGAWSRTYLVAPRAYRIGATRAAVATYAENPRSPNDLANDAPYRAWHDTTFSERERMQAGHEHDGSLS